MKIIKKLLIGIAILAVVLLVISLFLPAEVNVERSKTIEAPPEEIFAQINNLKNWQNWSPWYELDTAAKYTYGETYIGEGASYSWESDQGNVGNGSMKITVSKPHEYILTEMDFGSQGTATGYFRLKEKEGGTQVTWGFDTELGQNPFAKYMGLMMDMMLGPQFEKGLNNLEKEVEK